MKLFKLSYKHNIIKGERLFVAAMTSVGSFKYMPEIMNAYRNYSAGISSRSSTLKILVLFKALKKHFGSKYKKELIKRFFAWHGNLTLEYFSKSMYFKYCLELLKTLFCIRIFVDFRT
ncbi:MAG: hypothetical protein GX259_02440 [Bacteroidales bacterium]|nr:hypothetical protein [Bacteroidales bacterium]